MIDATAVEEALKFCLFRDAEVVDGKPLMEPIVA